MTNGAQNITNVVHMGGCKYLHDKMDYPNKALPFSLILSVYRLPSGPRDAPSQHKNTLSVKKLKIGHTPLP